MYWNTVTPLLRQVLEATMSSDTFNDFRLVGGTALSLRLGHRESVDIDLFTDAQYETIDFVPINDFFKSKYNYAETNAGTGIGMGTSYYVGTSENDAVKIDIYYTDSFIRPINEEKKIRMASLEDIITMKLDVIGRGGRKKDFWDLHALHDHYTVPDMIQLYIERHPYNHTREEIRSKLIDFRDAEDDFDPVCLLGKHWELIKLDFVSWVKEQLR